MRLGLRFCFNQSKINSVSVLQIKIQLNTKKIISMLSWIITFLIIMGIVVVLLYTLTPYRTAGGIVPLFDMDAESSITAYFSALDLAFAAVLLGFITHIKKQLGDTYWRHWLGLAVVFAFLSTDEAVSIHELVIALLKDHLRVGSGLPPHYMTGIIGITVLLLLSIPYGRFLWHLTSKQRARFLTAGVVFMGGAFGAEAVGGYIMTHPQWQFPGAYFIEIVIEESLEMIGILFFVRALLLYLEDLVPVSDKLTLLS